MKRKLMLLSTSIACPILISSSCVRNENDDKKTNNPEINRQKNKIENLITTNLKYNKETSNIYSNQATKENINIHIADEPTLVCDTFNVEILEPQKIKITFDIKDTNTNIKSDIHEIIMINFKVPVTFENDHNTNKNKNIVEVANNADLNLFYNLYGQSIYNNFIRMSMLVKGDVLFGINDNGLFVSNQKLLNQEKWLDYQKNYKINPGLNSRMVSLPPEARGKDDDKFTAIPYWKKVIIENPDKKINIWCRTGISQDQYFELSKYKNVIINFVEENPDRFHYWKNSVDKMIEEHQQKTNKSIKDTKFNKKSELPKSYFNCLLYANVVNKFNYWWSVDESYEYFKNNGFKNHLLFSGVDENGKAKNYDLTNEIFNVRDKNKKRLFSKWWPEISGYNWELQRDIVDEVMNNSKLKEKVLILGDLTPKQWDLVITAFEKYKDKYEFFYKGHPGHIEVPKYIDTDINVAGNKRYYNYLENKYKTFTMPKGRKITILNPQIISEELTTYHVKDEVDENGKVKKGLKFEKFVPVRIFSNALYGLNNGYNNYKEDILLAFDDQDNFADFSVNDTPLRQAFLEWFEKNLKQQ
ncbi:hypothetical protein [Mycoplasmopsis adleri]|uniref:hypothetical protein n=1 Tax=Mycoplasmopsis adleri TaxID=51362 RepID=UPI0038734A9C